MAYLSKLSPEALAELGGFVERFSASDPAAVMHLAAAVSRERARRDSLDGGGPQSHAPINVCDLSLPDAMVLQRNVVVIGNHATRATLVQFLADLQDELMIRVEAEAGEVVAQHEQLRRQAARESFNRQIRIDRERGELDDEWTTPESLGWKERQDGCP